MNHLTRLGLSLGAIATVMLAVFSFFTFLTYDVSPALSSSALPAGIVLPSPDVHPLPPTLAQWDDPQESGDYFDRIKPVNVGYLIWSRFPLQVYVEAVDSPWGEVVRSAIQEWQAYLPLEVGDRPESADIIIHRQRPPLELGPDGQLERVKAATTRYQLIVHPRLENGQNISLLSHRCHIFLTPKQTPEYTLATARHEMGHALGIWGHSPEPTDALYFAQVRHPPLISSRDLNTLKRIYQQPTRLGWPVRE